MKNKNYEKVLYFLAGIGAGFLLMKLIREI